MRWLVTGGLGQLGRALARQPARHELLFTDLPETDITDREEWSRLCHHEHPEGIIHCAAYTQVDKAEQDPEAAFRVNVLGTEHVAAVAAECGLPLVYVSTDYVFDGKSQQPYKEEDKVNPLSIYGATKEAGEQIVRQRVARHYIVRTAWLYGEGKNFVRTMLQLAEQRDELSVVQDQRGTPTSADEVAKAIFALIESECYGTYHATCQGEASWYEFACEIFRQKGRSVTVHPILTAQFPRPAPRPAYSVLDTQKLAQTIGEGLLPWQEALARYVRDGVYEYV